MTEKSVMEVLGFAKPKVVKQEGFAGEDIFACVISSNEERLRNLLATNSTAVNHSDEEGFTPLHVACQRGLTRMASLLIAAGANVEAKARDGCTPLLVASRTGNVLMVHYLMVQIGVQRDATDAGGHTALMHGCCTGKFKLVSYLLEAGGVAVDACDAKGATALHWAVLKKKSALLPLLIAKGADVHRVDPEGKTPLELADGDLRCTRALLRVGPNSSVAAGNWWWICTVPALWLLFLVHWAAFFVITLVATSEWPQRHIIGMGGFRSNIPFAVMCGTCVLLLCHSIVFLLPLFPYSTAILYALVTAMFIGLYFVKRKASLSFVEPTRLPSVTDWSCVPESKFCSFCVMRAPSRSHHCARCNRCVARFDHHCPWINECLGYHNTLHFCYMVLCAATGHALFVWQCYVFLMMEYEASLGTLFWSRNLHMIVMAVLAFAQAIGEGVLAYAQISGMLTDLTTTEMAHVKQQGQRNPFDRGVWTNVRQVCLCAQGEQIDYTTCVDGPEMKLSAWVGELAV